MRVQNIQQARINNNKQSFTAVKMNDNVLDFYREVILNNPQMKNIAKKYNIEVSEHTSKIFEDETITLAIRKIKESKNKLEKALNFFIPSKTFEVMLFDDKHHFMKQHNPETLKKKLENLSERRIEEYIEKEKEYKALERRKKEYQKATKTIK